MIRLFAASAATAAAGPPACGMDGFPNESFLRRAPCFRFILFYTYILYI